MFGLVKHVGFDQVSSFSCTLDIMISFSLLNATSPPSRGWLAMVISPPWIRTAGLWASTALCQCPFATWDHHAMADEARWIQTMSLLYKCMPLLTSNFKGQSLTARKFFMAWLVRHPWGWGGVGWGGIQYILILWCHGCDGTWMYKPVTRMFFLGFWLEIVERTDL
jgi:hypothetical protein